MSLLMVTEVTAINRLKRPWCLNKLNQGLPWLTCYCWCWLFVCFFSFSWSRWSQWQCMFRGQTKQVKIEFTIYWWIKTKLLHSWISSVKLEKGACEKDSFRKKRACFSLISVICFSFWSWLNRQLITNGALDSTKTETVEFLYSSVDWEIR